MKTMIANFSGQIGGLTPLMDEFNKPKFTKELLYHIPLFYYQYQQVVPDLVYIDEIGIQYQMDRKFNTDGGSIPPAVRLMPFVHLDPWNFPRAYLFHDCTYQYGGIYIKYSFDDVFKFRLQTRQQTDDRLSNMLPLDGATKVDQKTVMAGIWVGSRFVWDEKKKPVAQKQARHDAGIVVHDYEGNIIPD